MVALAELLEMRSEAFGSQAQDCLIRATAIYLDKSPQRKDRSCSGGSSGSGRYSPWAAGQVERGTRGRCPSRPA